MTGFTAIGWIMAGLSVAVIRAGWGGRRSVALAGWALGAVALVVLARGGGAWGMATGLTIGMIAALGFVLHAAWRSPASAPNAVRQAAALATPLDWGDVARRLAVFVLVVPVAFCSAQWLAFAVQALVRGGSDLDADSLALALFLQPVIWTALMCWQMTLPGPVRMVLPPLSAALLGAFLWGIS
ncbi:hypothetical protein H7F51_07900 [Novosphingobium flavum]|uniref:Uncharacterized protein n=1 Tax=Novosphingobium flavum TaxID=1778672 RepID=A0A7X1KLB9_9SPHN|nr:hypothetical protein [Novosphingobium flavum]